jgi:hypothetical protein
MRIRGEPLIANVAVLGLAVDDLTLRDLAALSRHDHPGGV